MVETQADARRTWRAARPEDDAAIVAMCLALYEEDPGPHPITEDHVRRTLAMLRANPSRGRAVVIEVATVVVGYAFLIAFWSNELGGECCSFDEIYIVPSARNAGLGSSLFDAVTRNPELAPHPPVALALEVTPGNVRARRLYERLGFSASNLGMRRLMHDARMIHR